MKASMHKKLYKPHNPTKDYIVHYNYSSTDILHKGQDFSVETLLFSLEKKLLFSYVYSHIK